VYLLQKFLELNTPYAEELGLLPQIEKAIKGEDDAYVVQTHLFDVLNNQTKYSVLYAFDGHQRLFPKGKEDEKKRRLIFFRNTLGCLPLGKMVLQG